MSRQAFKLAAMEQRVCAVTGAAGRAFHAHHVVRENDVPKGLDPHDPRNALRLTMAAHFDHHWGNRQITLSQLTDANIEYAFEVLGVQAVDYLTGRYPGEDPRVQSRASEGSVDG